MDTHCRALCLTRAASTRLSAVLRRTDLLLSSRCEFRSDLRHLESLSRGESARADYVARANRPATGTPTYPCCSSQHRRWRPGLRRQLPAVHWASTDPAAARQVHTSLRQLVVLHLARTLYGRLSAS